MIVTKAIAEERRELPPAANLKVKPRRQAGDRAWRSHQPRPARLGKLRLALSKRAQLARLARPFLSRAFPSIPPRLSTCPPAMARVSRILAAIAALIAVMAAPASAATSSCRTVCADPGIQGIGPRVRVCWRTLHPFLGITPRPPLRVAGLPPGVQHLRGRPLKPRHGVKSVKALRGRRR